VIKQTKSDTFEVEYVSENALTESQIYDIEKAITTYLESGLTFTFTRKEKLQRSKSGKLKQFVSMMK
jgi:phenylacetate-CoA ligase